jgi:predicted house-cleaning noncanonical NTP pyrophosphatase (MazG superfamily)
MEAGKERKRFSKKEGKEIIEGTLDVTEFFENKEESTKRLINARKGRPVYPSHKEREDILKRASKLREEVKAFREKHKIEDPPEYAARKIKEVGFCTNKYRIKRLRRKKRGNDLNNCNQARVNTKLSASD